VSFDYDRYRVDQLIRPVANLYRVTPLAVGETPAGPPIAYVRQKKLAIKEDIRFYADENQTQELFRVKARSMLDMGGSRYDIFVEDERIGMIWHKFRESLLRSTWHIGGPDEQEVALARESSTAVGIARRAIDFVPYVGEFVPIRYNFEIVINGDVVGNMNRRFLRVRDQYALDLSGDRERKIDRRIAVALAVGLDALQNR
jgi:uncharacterized protein YxjI